VANLIEEVTQVASLIEDEPLADKEITYDSIFSGEFKKESCPTEPRKNLFNIMSLIQMSMSDNIVEDGDDDEDETDIIKVPAKEDCAIDETDDIQVSIGEEDLTKSDEDETEDIEALFKKKGIPKMKLMNTSEFDLDFSNFMCELPDTSKE